MCRQFCRWAIIGSLLICVAASLAPWCLAASNVEARLASDRKEKEEWKPETLEGPAAIQAEQDAAARLNSMKNAQGRRKYLVISERIDPDAPEKRVTSINFLAKLDDETLKLTARLFRVGTVNASNSKIKDDQLKYLRGLSSMTSLVLSSTPLTDKGLLYIRPLTNLQTLHISGTKVSDRGMDSIARLTGLKILNLSQTRVTDKGLKSLLPLAKLDWLLLSETAITDAGLAQLADMKNLHRLTINKTKITDAGADRLIQSSPKLKIDR